MGAYLGRRLLYDVGPNFLKITVRMLYFMM